MIAPVTSSQKGLRHISRITTTRMGTAKINTTKERGARGFFAGVGGAGPSIVGGGVFSFSGFLGENGASRRVLKSGAVGALGVGATGGGDKGRGVSGKEDTVGDFGCPWPKTLADSGLGAGRDEVLTLR